MALAYDNEQQQSNLGKRRIPLPYRKAAKKRVFQEIRRVLRPGGRLQFADIANGKPVPASAMRNIDLWTA